jgi:hypothetical protein
MAADHRSGHEVVDDVSLGAGIVAPLCWDVEEPGADEAVVLARGGGCRANAGHALDEKEERSQDRGQPHRAPAHRAARTTYTTELVIVGE